MADVHRINCWKTTIIFKVIIDVSLFWTHWYWILPDVQVCLLKVKNGDRFSLSEEDIRALQTIQSMLAEKVRNTTLNQCRPWHAVRSSVSSGPNVSHMQVYWEFCVSVSSPHVLNFLFSIKQQEKCVWNCVCVCVCQERADRSNPQHYFLLTELHFLFQHYITNTVTHTLVCSLKSLCIEFEVQWDNPQAGTDSPAAMRVIPF